MKNVVLIVLCLAFIAWTAVSQVTPRTGGVLMYCESDFPKTFDPLTGVEDMSRIRLTTLLFESLIGIDMKRDCTYQLAEKATIAADKKQVDVRLRQGVKWSDGGELSAGDIVATLEAIKKSDNVPLQQAVSNILSVSALDAYTVRFIFARRMADRDLLRQLTFKILPEYKLDHLPLTVQSDLAKNPIGTGFFRFSERRPTYLTLKANEFYRNRYGNQKGPYIDEIQMYHVPDPQMQIENIVDQRVDVIVEVPPTSIPELQSARLQIVDYASLSFQFIAFNHARPLLNQRSIRQAMAYGFNRANLLDRVFQGKGRLVAGPFPPSSASYTLEVPPIPYDVAVAESLLAAAGFTGFDADHVRRNSAGQRLEFSLTTPRYPSGNDYYTRVFNQFISDMGRIGIRITQVDREIDHFRTAILKDHDFDLAFASLVYDEGENVAPLFRSTNTKPWALNYVSYNNSEVDQLLDLYDATSKPEELVNINLRLLRIMRNDCPYLFLWSLNKTAAARSRVRNFATTVTQYSFFDYANLWYLEE